MKYKQHRKLITLNCDCCGCSYEKPLSESDSDTRLMCKYIAEHFYSEGTISSPCVAA